MAVPVDADLTGKRITDIAKDQGRDPLDLLLDMSLEEDRKPPSSATF